MLLILYYAFTSDGALSIDTIVAAASWDNLRVLLDSVRFALYTTVLCLLLGYPVAYLLSRMNKSVAALLSVFFVVPMWMNFLLRTYAWKVLLGAFTKILYTEAAVLLGMVYNFLPFMILPIYTTLIKLDKSYIEAASDLGANNAVVSSRSCCRSRYRACSRASRWCSSRDDDVRHITQLLQARRRCSTAIIA